MSHFARYELETGRILYCGSVPESMLALQHQDGPVFIGEVDPRVHYIVDDTLTDRPAHAITLSANTVLANGQNEIQLLNVPTDARINVTGPIAMIATANGEDVTLTFGLPGKYAITVQAFPMIDFVGQIHAT